MNITSKRFIQDLALDEIIRERFKQDEKWGADRTIPIEAFARILGEEFGEICRAINEADKNNLKEELIQLGALSLAILEQIISVEYSKKEDIFEPTQASTV